MATKVEVPVKSKKTVVAKIEVTRFDSIQEAVETLGEKNVLDLVNTQHKTNLMNEARAAATGRPSKQTLTMKALATLAGTPEFAACAGDPARMQALIDSKVRELEAEFEANRPVVEDDDDEDDDDANNG